MDGCCEVDGKKFRLVPIEENGKLELMAVGNNYFVRTVTLYLLGQYLGTVEGFAVLANASWVADTGRFSEYLKKGTANEIEFGNSLSVRVNLGSVVDIWPWTHKLPTETK